MSKLRISMTLPGAISLGAYEGGALAAFLVAAKALGEDVMVVDSIAAASAGSITALLAARSLLRNADPVTLLTKAWVDLDSLEAMKTRSLDSPLSADALDEIARATVGPDGVPDGPATGMQQQPILLSFALANLAGLTYTIPNIQAGTSVQGSTNLDWYDVALTSADDDKKYLDVAPYALASGANAIGFPPRNLPRLADKDKYLAAGLQGFPPDGKFWYTDGGTINNEPIGRTIDLAQLIDSGDDRRLHLLIHPDPGSPADATTGPWSGDSPQPSWTRTGTHAFGLSRSQSIYEDLRRLAKTNSYVEWSKSITGAVESGVTNAIADLGLTQEQGEALRSALTAAATASLEDVRQKQNQVASDAGRLHGPRDPAGTTLEEVLSQLVGAATGLERREPVTVEVVSPLLQLKDGQTPGDVLAGEFLFHFGGFLDVRFRENDFALGYGNMQCWIETELEKHLQGAGDLDAAKAAVAGRANPEWANLELGKASIGTLSIAEKWEVSKLALHVAHVIASDIHNG